MSKRKYKKGERIWTLEELDNQEFVFFQNKVYHKGFWQSWQYRFVLENLKRGQFFKADRADQVMFVCYEENNHDLAIECGAITDLTVFGTAEKALKWFQGRVDKGIEDGFFMDREDDAVTGENVLYVPHVKEKIEQGFASITMFRGWQENWDESYEICVYEQEVQ